MPAPGEDAGAATAKPSAFRCHDAGPCCPAPPPLSRPKPPPRAPWSVKSPSTVLGGSANHQRTFRFGRAPRRRTTASAPRGRGRRKHAAIASCHHPAAAVVCEGIGWCGNRIFERHWPLLRSSGAEIRAPCRDVVERSLWTWELPAQARWCRLFASSRRCEDAFMEMRQTWPTSC